MNIFQHSRFKIFNESQHPLKHDLSGLAYSNARLPGISTLVETIDYLTAALYPNYIGTYATPAALPVSSSPNDYAIVTDDGDGKSAGYVWLVLENGGSWSKRYDVDWSLEAIFAEGLNRTQYMYMHKFGFQDLDATGAALTGTLAGQHLYGGTAVGSHLTLHANSANADTTGFIQIADNVRPFATATWSLGTTGNRWTNVYSAILTAGTMAISGGAIADSSGAITFGALNLTTTGEIKSATGKISGSLEVGPFAGNALILAPGSITDESGAISFGDENISTTGTITGVTGYFSSSAEIGPLAGNALVLAAGSITDQSGAISFGSMNLVTTGTLGAGDTTVTKLSCDNLRLDGNTLSSLDVNGTINLAPNGAGIVAVAGPMTTLGVTTTGILAVTGSITVDNLSLDGNTLATTNANGILLLVPNGSGTIELGSAFYPTTSASWDIGKTGKLWLNLWISGNLKDGTNIFTIPELMTLKSANWRDAGRTSAVQTGDTLFWSGTQWLASVPDTEIAHGSISGLTTTDAGHTQFVMLAGRSGGQTVQGGTASGEHLLLESTAHASKGLIKVKDNIVANTNASYSGGWSGTDIGGTSNYFKDVYTKGEFKGLRFENYTVATLPAASGQNTGRAMWATDTKSLYVDDGGTSLIRLGGGGGGGGSLAWVEDTDSPLATHENGDQVYTFEDVLTQQLYALIRVPSSYVAGSPITLRTAFYSAITSGTALIRAQATLIRTGTDAVTTTTNQRTTTNTAVTLSAGTNNIPQAVALDISSSSGQINGVAIAPSDFIRVRLYRDTATDTAAGDVKVPVYGAEVSFS